MSTDSNDEVNEIKFSDPFNSELFISYVFYQERIIGATFKFE